MVEPTIAIHHSAEAAAADNQSIGRSLVSENLARAVPEHYQALTVAMRVDGLLIGGAVGYTHWSWLFISNLWLEPTWRAKGHGRSLLRSIEDAALQRGCRHAHLDTFSFQSLPFYLRCGYRIFGQLADYPPGQTRYFVTRDLTAGPA